MKIVKAVLFAVLALGLIHSSVYAAGKEEVRLSDLPKAVKKTIEEHAGDGTIQKIQKDKDDKGIVYCVTVEANNQTEEFKVDSKGKFIEGNTAHNERDGHNKKDPKNY